MNESNESNDENHRAKASTCSFENAQTLRNKHKEQLRNPDTHPEYKKEWKTFWYLRYAQLKRENKLNPDTYDYKSEWIKHWKTRLKALHEEEERTFENLEYGKIDRKRQKSEIQSKFSRSPKKKSTNIEAISSDELSDFYKSPPSKSRQSLTKASGYSNKARTSYEERSCYSTERTRHYTNQNLEYDDRERINYEESRRSRKEVATYDMEYDANEVSLISVLRLLSALESELGLLYEKVIDILSKALALEKLKHNSSEEVLMTTENCVLLETIKEKLKGLLIVNLIPVNKIEAIKRSIQDIAKLVKQAPVVCALQLDSELTNLSASKIDVKLELAARIADAIKAHGKDDLTLDELEILVEVYLESVQKENNQNTFKKPEHEATQFDDSLTDEDFKILLNNFECLEKDEQEVFIKFISENEKLSPKRVEILHNYLNLTADAKNSSCQSTQNSTSEIIDDCDDDYNINEIIRNALANVDSSHLTDNLPLALGRKCN